MNLSTQKIRSIALASGADMIGFAPVERFDAGPEKTHPRYYMPKARSAIVVGIGYTKAICDVWGTYEEEGRLPTPYMMFGFAQLNWELSRIALKIAKVLETFGFRSLPIPPSYALSRYRYWEDLDKTKKYMGDLSIKHAALAAGLGTFGWNNLILTPSFGARQRLIAIVTEAQLEPGELIFPEKLCKPESCGYACVKACPINALNKSKAQEFVMDGCTFRYSVLDHNLCRWCLDGLKKGSGSRTHIELPEKITQDDIHKAHAKRALVDKGLYAMGFIDFCGKCMHQCPSPDFEITTYPNSK